MTSDIFLSYKKRQNLGCHTSNFFLYHRIIILSVLMLCLHFLKETTPTNSSTHNTVVNPAVMEKRPLNGKYTAVTDPKLCPTWERCLFTLRPPSRAH